jgi:hypothetical protein
MAAPLAQIIVVPDVGVGPGPWPSPAWVPAGFATLTRLGLEVAATGADRVILLGSGIGPGDPIDLTNPNRIAYFTGPGMHAAELLKFASACSFYAFLRMPPPNGGAPTVNLNFEMIGTP